MRFLSIFPEAEDIHLTKDVGMLPFSLHHYWAYESTLLCNKNGIYPNLSKDTPGLKVSFLPLTKKNPLVNVIQYLLRYYKDFDCVQTYHLQWRSLIWLYTFKLLKPKGKTYLKLDANERILNWNPAWYKKRIQHFLLKKIDLVSVESSKLQIALIEKWGIPIAKIPNGYQNINSDFTKFESKENILLQVGRIGAPEKKNELSVHAFIKIADKFPDWKLQLVGHTTPHFKTFIETLLDKHPHLSNRIILSGPISDRTTLMSIYAKAKVFCSSSSFESFGIAMIEAAAHGCFIITTDVVSAQDITNNSTLGIVIPIDDGAALSRAFEEALTNDALLRNNCIPIQEYVQNNFSWEKIATTLNALLTTTNP